MAADCPAELPNGELVTRSSLHSEFPCWLWFLPFVSGSVCLLPVFLDFLVVSHLALQNATLPALPLNIGMFISSSSDSHVTLNSLFPKFFSDTKIKPWGLQGDLDSSSFILYVATVKEVAEETQRSVCIIKKCFCHCGHPRGGYSSFLARLHHQPQEAVNGRICPRIYSIF